MNMTQEEMDEYIKRRNVCVDGEVNLYNIKEVTMRQWLKQLFCKHEYKSGYVQNYKPIIKCRKCDKIIACPRG